MNLVTGTVKAISGAAGAIILDILCDIDLGIVSWFIIAAPFIITSLATSIALGIGIDRLFIKTVQEKFIGGPFEEVPAASDEIK